jgi:hypothetical protein
LSPDRELKAGLLETETGVLNRLPQCSEYCVILFFEWFNPLAPELYFFLILAHSVYKM